MGVGTAGSLSHSATLCRVWSELAAARDSAASRSWAAGPHRSRRFSSATVEDEVPGEAVGVFYGVQPGEQVPPPGLRLVGDVLRVEQPHPPSVRGAQRGGGRPQVGLVGGGDDRAGRGQHERDRLRGGLARPWCHERDDRVPPPGVDRRPGAAVGARELSKRQPGVGGLDRPRVGSGQRPAQPGSRTGGMPVGQPRHLRVMRPARRPGRPERSGASGSLAQRPR